MLFILFFIDGIIGDELIQSQILWRHGARTPLHCNWNCKDFKEKGMLSGFLTPTGMRQHYVLGQWLRQRYVYELKLLKEVYDEEEIYAESTDVNRTIMSALSNLQGIYPSGTGPNIKDELNHSYFLPPNVNHYEEIGLAAIPPKLQLVPVHVRQKSQDIILRGYDPLSCPRNNQFIMTNLMSDQYQQINKKSKSLIDEFSQQMNLDPLTLNITSLYEFQDTFDSCLYNGYKMPNLQQSTVERMKLIQNLYFNLEHFANFDQTRLLATPFLEKIITNMINITKKEIKHKFRIFSAHDTTVLLILNALNFTSVECMKQVYFGEPVDNPNCIYTLPGYASNIIFELYKNDLGNYYVQILYNGTVMPICNNQKQCDFEQFKSIINFQNVENYEEECLIMSLRSQDRMATWLIVCISVAITLLVVFSACVTFLLIRKRRYEKYSKAAHQFEA